MDGGRARIAAGLAAVLLAGPAAAAPANSLDELSRQIQGCMAEVRVTRGTDVTVQFMLNRRGGLIGKPHITHAGWVAGEPDRKASAAAIAQGFDRCLPAAVSDRLGGAIAGRLFTYRFQAPSTPQEKA